MAEGNSVGTYIGLGTGISLILLMGLIALLTMRKMKSKIAKKIQESSRIINFSSTTWYDPKFQKLVPEQVAHSDVHVENELLAVSSPIKRARSAECLALLGNDEISTSNLWTTKQLSISSQSLCSLVDERISDNVDAPRQYHTLKSSPYVEFNLLWAASSSSLSVYVIRTISLPPSYCNATYSYRVTLHKPDKTTISRSSDKVKAINLNPDCFQVFSYPVPLEEVQMSELVLEVLARKSKHFLTKVIGQLNYKLPCDLEADKFITITHPLTVNKKGSPSVFGSPRGSLSDASGSHWGELQVLAQYRMIGRWGGRIKIMIIKAQNAIIGKAGGGSYMVELIVKQGEETQAVHQTKQVQGPNPVWKTPFIFDVTQEKVSEYRVEMSLIRISWLKRLTTIGQTVLGLNTTPSGTQHWQSLIEKPNKELTLWHPVTYQD